MMAEGQQLNHQPSNEESPTPSPQRRLEPSRLTWRPWSDVRWTEQDRPVVILDGSLHRVAALPSHQAADSAYVVGLHQEDLSVFARAVSVRSLYCYELRAADLSVLSSVSDLVDLTIHWNPKLVDLSTIADLDLETLALIDTPKVQELRPLAGLPTLKALEYTGGILKWNFATSLDPIAALPELEELRIGSVRIASDGLRPLARCKSLKYLDLSNQYPTEDYAYLAAALPHVQCDLFHPWVRFPEQNGKDTMITGRRKPFLHSRDDADRIRKYEIAFEQLRNRFAAEFAESSPPLQPT